MFPHTSEQIPGGLNYAVLKLDDHMVGGHFRNESEPPNWLVYFAVADADESARQVTDHGGKVVRDGWMGTFEDPTGARFALMKLPAA